MYYKDYRKNSMERVFKIDPAKGEDMDLNQINITGVIVFGQVLEVIGLTIVILNICYFMGLSWNIYCMITSRHLDGHSELAPEILEQ